MTRLYLDFSFLVRLILRTQGTRFANRVISQFAPPFPINDLLVLQVENFFDHAMTGSPATMAMVSQGRAFWRREINELVFQTTEVDWSRVCRDAVAQNRGATAWLGSPVSLLNIAAALRQRATHLLSFDPPQRLLAKRLGMHVMPEVLG